MSENYIEADLIHCIYASTAKEKLEKNQIVSILEKARKKNSSINVTGMLLYDDGAFFQILEGKREVVEKLLVEISNDKRHDRIVKIIIEPIEERSFSEWTMGYSGATRSDLQKVDGLNDFFSKNRSFTELDEGRAKKLLAAFKSGQWRASLR
ncbi:BLUF domain-containing protein [Pseudomaricurvus sp.]|uniref:BLUF domain-containing protein n=1 Tax=Pseudomaricurvus sp. TaxID=2004510 RepID=UPI003F6B3272